MNLSTIEQGEELLKQSSRGPWTLNIGRFGYPASIDCAIPNEPVVYRGIEGDGGVCMKEDAEFIVWLQNHASELLQMAREVERLNELVKCHETGEWLTKEEERAVYKKMYNYHVCNTGCGLHCSQIPLNHAY